MEKTAYLRYYSGFSPQAPLGSSSLHPPPSEWSKLEAEAGARSSLAGWDLRMPAASVLIFTVSRYRWQAMLIFHLWQ